jgi:hypothetical protein
MKSYFQKLVITPRARALLVVVICLAVLGLVLRGAFAPGHTLHDIGLLLSMLWFVLVIWAATFFFSKANPIGPDAINFKPGKPVVPHRRGTLTLIQQDATASQAFEVAPGEFVFICVVNAHGFLARVHFGVDEIAALKQSQSVNVAVQFRAPSLALPALSDAAEIAVYVKDLRVGTLVLEKNEL